MYVESCKIGASEGYSSDRVLVILPYTNTGFGRHCVDICIKLLGTLDCKYHQV
jgi:hypothetical protein